MSQITEQNDVEFNNERLIINNYVKENFKDVLEEHIKRYEFTYQFIKNKNVLDAACGSGYGSKMIKDAGARYVTGIDISYESIQNAKITYFDENIEFLVNDINNTNIKDKSFDVIVSFETIEHIDNGLMWINEASRLLYDNGLFIVSTPNRLITNHLKNFNDIVRNPFHKYEYSLLEFIGELTTKFDIVGLYGQNFIPNKLLTSYYTNYKIIYFYYKTFVQKKSNNINMERIFRFLINSIKNRNKTKFKLRINKINIFDNKFNIVNLSNVKDLQPMYMIAVCRKKSNT